LEQRSALHAADRQVRCYTQADPETRGRAQSSPAGRRSSEAALRGRGHNQGIADEPGGQRRVCFALGKLAVGRRPSRLSDGILCGQACSHESETPPARRQSVAWPTHRHVKSRESHPHLQYIRVGCLFYNSKCKPEGRTHRYHAGKAPFSRSGTRRRSQRQAGRGLGEIRGFTGYVGHSGYSLSYKLAFARAA